MGYGRFYGKLLGLLGCVAVDRWMWNRFGTVGFGIVENRGDCHLCDSVAFVAALMLGGSIKLYGYLISDGLQGRIADIMPIRWSFEALTVLEYNNLQRSNENVRDLSEVIGFSANNLGMSCGALLGFTMLFWGMTLLRLQFWESKSS